MNKFFKKHLPKAQIPGKKFKGEGKTVGSSSNSSGNSSNTVLVPIVLKKYKKAVDIGIKFEKSSTGGTKIVSVGDKSIGEFSGLLRGDLVCFGGSDGQAEIMYDHFCLMLKELESNEGEVIEIEVVRSARIAAAAAREKAHKERSKPMGSSGNSQNKNKKQSNSLAAKETKIYELPPPSSSEESKAAARAAKARETQMASALGYNPYEVVKSGSALGAAAAVSNSQQQQQKDPSSEEATKESSHNENDGDVDTTAEEIVMDEQCQKALETVFQMRLRCTDDVSLAQTNQSLLTAHKIITNAITKGQVEGEKGDKFRRVRLANARIQKDILNVEGALDLMLLVGFQLMEDDATKENILVFPMGEAIPEWMQYFLKKMKKLAEESS